MTVAHKNLSGTDLHEPKGIGGASLNTVYVCTSAGTSGTWQKISVDQLTGTGKAFQGQLFHAVDEKSSGTAGGTFNNAAWRTRTLNTIRTNQISGASLSTNQITLPAGTYYIDARAPAFFVDGHKIGLSNITDGTDAVLEGSSEFSGTACQTFSRMTGQFTIASQKVFEIRHICATSRSTDGFGNEASTGTSEHYAEVMIWKIG